MDGASDRSGVGRTGSNQILWNQESNLFQLFLAKIIVTRIDFILKENLFHVRAFQGQDSTRSIIVNPRVPFYPLFPVPTPEPWVPF